MKTMTRLALNLTLAAILAPCVGGAVAGILGLMGATTLAAGCGGLVVGMFFAAWVAGSGFGDEE